MSVRKGLQEVASACLRERASAALVPGDGAIVRSCIAEGPGASSAAP